MFCQYCGRQLSDEAAFCPHCGAKLIKTDNTAPRQNAATQYGAPQSAPISQVPVQPQKLPLNGFGIASFVIGIVCLVLGGDRGNHTRRGRGRAPSQIFPERPCHRGTCDQLRRACTLGSDLVLGARLHLGSVSLSFALFIYVTFRIFASRIPVREFFSTIRQNTT